ncbi:hypothetical protein K443DRAFT_15897 [Laccaria amethystina LaAM-08-1]|uniref:Uncharacterized protein n=1 Tax=Laccaria amethystina LaAM-08-1 TaxID=1095629 RepID=A0A0C9WPV4_9AGAR|nr:hypothetical protein K443DRAFT_15897 [Laccaria amethystina LaAM-08-1]
MLIQATFTEYQLPYTPLNVEDIRQDRRRIEPQSPFSSDTPPTLKHSFCECPAFIQLCQRCNVRSEYQALTDTLVAISCRVHRCTANASGEPHLLNRDTDVEIPDVSTKTTLLSMAKIVRWEYILNTNSELRGIYTFSCAACRLLNRRRFNPTVQF